jgi:hypothetical protein
MITMIRNWNFHREHECQKFTVRLVHVYGRVQRDGTRVQPAMRQPSPLPIASRPDDVGHLGYLPLWGRRIGSARRHPSMSPEADKVPEYRRGTACCADFPGRRTRSNNDDQRPDYIRALPSALLLFFTREWAASGLSNHPAGPDGAGLSLAGPHPSYRHPSTGRQRVRVQRRHPTGHWWSVVVVVPR